eukprot:CFRG1188T1
MESIPGQSSFIDNNDNGMVHELKTETEADPYPSVSGLTCTVEDVPTDGGKTESTSERFTPSLRTAGRQRPEKLNLKKHLNVDSDSRPQFHSPRQTSSSVPLQVQFLTPASPQEPVKSRSCVASTFPHTRSIPAFDPQHGRRGTHSLSAAGLPISRRVTPPVRSKSSTLLNSRFFRHLTPSRLLTSRLWSDVSLSSSSSPKSAGVDRPSSTSPSLDDHDSDTGSGLSNCGGRRRTNSQSSSLSKSSNISKHSPIHCNEDRGRRVNAHPKSPKSLDSSGLSCSPRNMVPSPRSVMHNFGDKVSMVMFDQIVTPTTIRKQHTPKENDLPENDNHDVALDASFMVYRVLIVKNRMNREELQFKYTVKTNNLWVMKLSVVGIELERERNPKKHKSVHSFKYQNLKGITLKDPKKEKNIKIVAFEFDQAGGIDIVAVASHQCEDIIAKLKLLLWKAKYAGHYCEGR